MSTLPLEIESAPRNPWGGIDWKLTNSGVIRTTDLDLGREIIRLDEHGVLLWKITFDHGTPDEIVADAFFLAMRFDEPHAPTGRIAHGALLDVDTLAQIIRTVDGNYDLGAGALAEAILAELGR